VREVDIVYAGYVLNELKPELVEVYLEALYAKVKNNGFLIVVEYGSPFGARLVHEVRKWAIEKKMYIAAPCPHHGKCPLAKEKSWCHFDQPSGMYPKNIFGSLPTDQAVRL
jgi:ribosomal protein RSM22 (predicted rRNA methylase)